MWHLTVPKHSTEVKSILTLSVWPYSLTFGYYKFIAERTALLHLSDKRKGLEIIHLHFTDQIWFQVDNDSTSLSYRVACKESQFYSLPFKQAIANMY